MPGSTNRFLQVLTSEIIKDKSNPEQVHHLVLPSEKESFFEKYDHDEVTSYGAHVRGI